MIGPAGFMHGPSAPLPRIAWCVRCDGPQDCDKGGCIACQKKQARRKSKAFAARLRRERLKTETTCINARSHGAPLPGRTKCARCVEVHRRSA